MKVYETAYSTIVMPDSAVDAEVALQLNAALSDIDAPINGRVIVDLEESSYISADGICVLLDNHSRAEQRYRLELRNTNENVGDLLCTAGLGSLISDWEI